ncbi:glycerophosphodiester phosphodiesterase family protein [Psychroserpens sp. SPM9]|uniref:glycerophosphodiester phosphodiesterase family protein n=1 Tax=Psychroserpens sp. SPM9 TaxID=2975598 RepID=UPI0021A36216|nr:glycerophosphodiester phosphodiesterase family protein [Psychroserpens sp. SPM9]MDG5492635.1 glycerophosphodiester phosphodiesterase family protein [Psychroserpens sp. SPM9]
MRFFWLFCVVGFLSCSSKNELDVQGHRGCRGLHPENSLPAFKKAIDLGVQTLEMDVVISKDHEVVVSHEPFINHTIALDLFGNEITSENEMTFNLYTMPYDSIKLYDCGTKMHPAYPFQKKEKVYKPLLSEVIDLAETKSEHQIVYNIEIKSKPEYDGVYSPPVEDYVSLVLNRIHSKGIQDRTVIQSFDLRALELTKKQNPKLQTALLVDENENIETKLSQLSFKPEIVSPYFKLLDQQTVSKYQDQGFKIIPWTVNLVSDINWMIDLNVDGIISDYPNKVIQVKQLKK